MLLFTKVPSSTYTQSLTPSETTQASGEMSAATVIDGIDEALAGTLLLTLLLTLEIGFFLVRSCTPFFPICLTDLLLTSSVVVVGKRSTENAFDASQFRGSGVLDEKDDNTRPLSMKEEIHPRLLLPTLTSMNHLSVHGEAEAA
jgi:hypothetical protein